MSSSTSKSEPDTNEQVDEVKVEGFFKKMNENKEYKDLWNRFVILYFMNTLTKDEDLYKTFRNMQVHGQTEQTEHVLSTLKSDLESLLRSEEKPVLESIAKRLSARQGPKLESVPTDTSEFTFNTPSQVSQIPSDLEVHKKVIQQINDAQVLIKERISDLDRLKKEKAPLLIG